jgi:hypothetical protein
MTWAYLYFFTYYRQFIHEFPDGCLIRWRNYLPFASISVRPRLLLGSVLFPFFCFLCGALFVLVLCLVCPVLPLSLDWPFLISPSVCCDVYFLWSHLGMLTVLLDWYIFWLSLWYLQTFHNAGNYRVELRRTHCNVTNRNNKDVWRVDTYIQTRYWTVCLDLHSNRPITI